MPKGFVHPYLLLVAFAVIGVGVAVFAGSKGFSGFVLGSRSNKESVNTDKIDSYKVTVISPNSSWDLIQYLCKTHEECEKSSTAGTWWSAVGGAATTLDGHEILIDKSDKWSDYSFLKIFVRSSAGDKYLLQNLGTEDLIIALSSGEPLNNYVFVSSPGNY